MRVPSGNIQTYQRSVSLGAMPNARVDAPGDANAYGAGIGRAMEGMGGALQKAASAADKLQEDKIASDVVAAQTEYQKRLSDALYSGDNALLTRQGENAAKLDTEYADIERKIRQETLAKLPAYELAHTAFNRVADKERQSGLDMVNRYRIQEGEKTFKLTLANAAATAAETTSRNYNNPVALQSGIDRITELSRVRAAKYGAAEAEAFQRDNMGKLFESTLGAAYAQDDFKSIESILTTHRDKISPDVANKWGAASTAKQKKNDQAALLSSLRDNPAFKDANGYFDPQKALEHVRGLKKTVTTGGDFESGFATFKASQVGVESGGNYAARGPVMEDGDQALGAYQIMSSNWGPWSKEAGLGDGAPLTPENQDKVYRFKIKQYYDQFGGDWGKVAVAWHAGPGKANWSEADLDKIDDGNMTTLQYKRAVLQNTGVTREEAKYDDAELATLEKQFEVLRSEDIRKDTQAQNIAIRNVQDWLATNKDLPLDQKVAFVNAAGLRPAQAEALTTGMIKETRAEHKAKMEETSKVAEGTLELLDARDALTTSNVEALAGQLTPASYLKYMAKATRAQKTDGEKANNAADKTWHTTIKNDSTFGNTDRQNALIASITEILDVEKTEGSDRRVKASKLIEEARDTGKRNYIAGYSARNNQAFLQMEELFPGASTLVRKGDPNVDGYEWIGILKGWSAQTYTDPAAAKAWNTIFTKQLPLTENSFNELTEFYRREGAQ